ncbi:uncharacterized protein LOC124440619 [Xenia sp. Carnegie-2017]|uniref:uncharacterized protein LOC124440619 n=1 Tax=Xenia sp. Carnegie-2017 TaxID=2897299 RepID=UPI001F04EABF|nr:uncharacterized protein LOC124440619 [Xenia sp. Carnegie-2017]
MVEGSLKSVDPLAYYVNNVADFDKEIVRACKQDDAAAIKRLASRGNSEFDIFICISQNWHGFVLCVPAGLDSSFKDMITDVIKTPFDVPELVLCHTFELCYDDERLRTYKIRKRFSLFRDIQEKIKRTFFIGHYKEISPSGFQICAIRAAPHRYALLLEDCVEFSKEFCIQALRFCSNGREIEDEVKRNMKDATATGFSFEHLSRNIKSSAWFGNLLINGTDISTMISSRNPTVLNSIFLFFLIIYPIIVVFVYHRCIHPLI